MNRSYVSPRLIVGIGFESLFDDSVDWPQIRENFDRAGVTGFTLSVGRTEWLAFPWEGHEQQWSSQARKHKGDRIAEIIGFLTADFPREVSLVIDALAPLNIARDPANGGSFANGVASPEFPSATALSLGCIGRKIVELAEEVARRYKPDRIELTELIGDVFFNGDDENLFRNVAGSPGFRRGADGHISITNTRLCKWQAEMVTDMARRCIEVISPHGVGFGLDVRVNWRSPGADRLDSGHAYKKLLDADSSLTIWAYFGTENLPASATAALVSGLNSRFSPEEIGRITLSIGLWGNDATISPAELSRALDTTGQLTVSITPMSLMTPQHWAAIWQNSHHPLRKETTK